MYRKIEWKGNGGRTKDRYRNSFLMGFAFLSASLVSGASDTGSVSTGGVLMTGDWFSGIGAVSGQTTFGKSVFVLIMASSSSTRDADGLLK